MIHLVRFIKNYVTVLPAALRVAVYSEFETFRIAPDYGYRCFKLVRHIGYKALSRLIDKSTVFKLRRELDILILQFVKRLAQRV